MDIPYELLIKYCKKQTSTDENKWVEEWLSEKDNMILFSELKKEWKYIDDESFIFPDKSKVLEKVMATIYKSKEKKKIIFQKPFRYAAAVLLICIITSASIALIKSIFKESEISPIEIVKTGTNEKLQIILSDGTSVWLNSNSQLSYDETFNTQQREVFIDGELFFDVSHSDKKFIVNAGFIKIEVLGTSFNVKTNTDNENIEIALKEGQISVVDSTNDVLFTLEPSQFATIHKSDKTYNIIQEDLSYNDIWKENTLIIENEPLAVLIPKLEGWYGMKIIIEGVDLSNRYTFLLEKENIYEFLDLFSFVSPIDYQINDHILYIKGQEKITQ